VASPARAASGPPIAADDAPGGPLGPPAAASMLMGAVAAGSGASVIVAAVLAALFVLVSPGVAGARVASGGRWPPDPLLLRSERPG
jgi:hypothetical protein